MSDYVSSFDFKPMHLSRFVYISPSETWILSEFKQPKETDLKKFLFYDLYELLKYANLTHHHPDDELPEGHFNTIQRARMFDGIWGLIHYGMNQPYRLTMTHHPVPYIKPTHHYLSRTRHSAGRLVNSYLSGSFFCRNHFPTLDRLSTFTLVQPLNPNETHRAQLLTNRFTSPSTNAEIATQTLADWLSYSTNYLREYPDLYTFQNRNGLTDETETNTWRKFHPRNKEIRLSVGFPYGFSEELYAGALENPDDHAYWLIFADHLEETGIYPSLMNLIRFFIGDPPPYQTVSK